MTLRISLDLDDMTYGQLIDFADAARAAGVDRSEPVTQVFVPNDDSIVDRFDLDVDRLPLSTRTLTGDQASVFVNSIQTVIDQQGDARGELETLIELRDLLR